MENEPAGPELAEHTKRIQLRLQIAALRIPPSKAGPTSLICRNAIHQQRKGPLQRSSRRYACGQSWVYNSHNWRDEEASQDAFLQSVENAKQCDR
ncbi:hypothetical protein DL768_009971 [Monosporascus sp. mg162]|nr:hypothetical protein DL768_009971 [Monosporascus sp. mg162]